MTKLDQLLIDIGNVSERKLKCEEVYNKYCEAKSKLNAKVRSLSSLIDQLNREQLKNINLKE